MKVQCRHDVNHEGIFTVMCACGREVSKVPDGKGGYTYPWKPTDRLCKHCERIRRDNG